MFLSKLTIANKKVQTWSKLITETDVDLKNRRGAARAGLYVDVYKNFEAC